MALRALIWICNASSFIVLEKLNHQILEMVVGVTCLLFRETFSIVEELDDRTQSGPIFGCPVFIAVNVFCKLLVNAVEGIGKHGCRVKVCADQKTIGL